MSDLDGDEFGPKTVYITGMHSGPNPSPGVGVARSLRLFRPAVRLIGVDYSSASSGLHSDLLDDVIRFPSWSDIDPQTWAEEIGELLCDERAVLLPGLDLEVRLLAEFVGDNPRLLAPGKAALAAVIKPAIEIADELGMTTPPHQFDTGLPAVDQFVRNSEHGVWVKGPHYEAFRVNRTRDAMAAGSHVQAVWGSWHLEAHVPGQECGLAFCAREGVLLDAILVVKTLLTSEGKTWSGAVCEVDPDLWSRVARFVERVGWHGGGEIELIQSWEGDFTVLEINPRFPAWIHGGTVSSANLPAALVFGEARTIDRTLGGGFTRVVEEIPVRSRLGLRPFGWTPDDFFARDAKNPSGMPEVSRRNLVASGRTPTESPSTVSWAEHGLPTSSSVVLETPHRELLPAALTARIAALATELTGLPSFTVAYSVKTCPVPRLLRVAAAAGLAAEAISLDELDAAAAAGFDPGRAILNGPAKWWPRRSSVRCRAFFADSAAELRQVIDRLDAGFDLECETAGVRVAPLGVQSRFGVRFIDSRAASEVAALLSELRDRTGTGWGLHFHHAQSVLGRKRWEAEALAAAQLVDVFQELLGGSPDMISLGGGWHADDLGLLRGSLNAVLERGPECLLDGDTELVLEPGKLLTEPAAAVLTRVLLRDGDDLVVDAALADIPEAVYRPHPVARFDSGRFQPLSHGPGRVLGRTCMESDVLAVELDLTGLREGDVLAFGSCGAYDQSMSYSFGRGGA